MSVSGDLSPLEGEDLIDFALRQTSQASGENDGDDEELHPLFWDSAPGADASAQAQMYQEALTKMVYDDRTPAELAADFKERGNELFKRGKKYYKHAVKKYDEALQWARKSEPTDESRACYAAILTNRAAINLALGNLGSVKRDCRAAIRFGPIPPRNCKAYFRGATACKRLGQNRAAKELVSAGLVVDPENGPLRKLGEEVGASLKAQERRERARERELYEERRSDEAMRRQCKRRGVRLGPLTMDVQQYTGQLESGGLRGRCSRGLGGAPRPAEDAQGELHWAVILMYPEHGQSDFIADWGEACPLWQQLACIVPPTRENSVLAEEAGVSFAPWDGERAYCLDQLEVFFQERPVRAFDMARPLEGQFEAASEREHDPETRDWGKKGWVRLGLECTLGEVLSHPSYVVPGLPVLYVFSRAPASAAATFLSEFKEKTMGGGVRVFEGSS